ncbi:unnamed protein product [Coffea canephora]|uniref:RING-type domain-containing protein n=1 Tax=Coffea canephora TaxID=49390 RepID=A0A068TVB1_COFCA|nr:unnamed protein product [Coffea canephora]
MPWIQSGSLDQAFIDALPVFLYKDIMGLKEPFDCAVCLCEFSEQDKGALFSPEFSVENPVFEFDESRDEDWVVSGNVGVAVPCGPKPSEAENSINEKRVFSVRLGKFRNTSPNDCARGEDIEVGETSNSNLDARRCFSMGSFQYVVADSELQVSLCHKRPRGHGLDPRLQKAEEKGGQNGNSLNDEDIEGKKINMRSKGESFSVSKVWLWSNSNKGKFPNSTENQISSSINVSLPWTARTHKSIARCP